MVRKGWTMIEVPEGWTQLIGGRCPLSVKWPLADQRRQRNSSAIPQESSTSTIQGGAHTVQSKVDRLQSALQALGPKDSSARSAWCNQDCEGRSTETSSSTTESCRSCSTSWPRRSSSGIIGRRRSQRGAFESCVETGKIAGTCTSSWRTSRFASSVRQACCAGRGASAGSQRSPGADGGEIGQSNGAE